MPKKSAPAGAQPKITSADMRAALKRHFSHPEYGIVFEVAHGTGWQAHRHVDAVAMDTWPSRGLTLHAIEIKVDRGDWRREKREPEKAEQLARFCDLFWIAAPAGIVPIDEIPEAWGLLELGPKGIGITKKAAKTKSVAVDRNFLAGVMRAAGRGLVPDDLTASLKSRRETLDQEFETKVADAVERKRLAGESGAKQWAKLMHELGETETPDEFAKWWDHDTENIIACVKALRASGITQCYRGLADLQKGLADLKTNLDNAMSVLHIAPKPDAAVLAERIRKPQGRLV